MMETRNPRSAVKVACFGLGAMGSAILGRLARKGFDAHGYDINPQTIENVRNQGLSADLVDDWRTTSEDVILSCVPADEQVFALLTGERGVLNELRPGSSVIETSSVLPETVRKVAETASSQGLSFIDVGVTGGPEALEGDKDGLTLYAGGLARASTSAQLVLNSIGETVDCGEIGNGKLTKLINNLMSWGNIAVAAEAFNIGTAAGLDERQLYQALARGGGRSNQFVKRFDRLINGDETTYFSVELGAKDVRLARLVAEEVSSDTPLASVLEKLYERAEGTMPHDDIVSIYKYYRDGLQSSSLDDEKEA